MQSMVSVPIWLVDDDEDDQLLIQAAFRAVYPPVEVLTFTNGEELLGALASGPEQPRLILLDINMPRKNGFETLTELRSMIGLADLPVVMLTTSSGEYERSHSLALGANGFLTKPLTYQQLTELAQELSQQWLVGQ